LKLFSDLFEVGLRVVKHDDRALVHCIGIHCLNTINSLRGNPYLRRGIPSDTSRDFEFHRFLSSQCVAGRPEPNGQDCSKCQHQHHSRSHKVAPLIFFVNNITWIQMKSRRFSPWPFLSPGRTRIKKSLTFYFELERITQSFRGELSSREEIFCRMEVKSVT